MNSLEKKHTIWHSLINPYSLTSFLDTCRMLYERNNIAKVMPDKEPRIPCIIHQIWVGSPFPEKYKALQKTWKSIPGWEYKLWTDKEIDELTFENKDLYYKAKNYGARADIVRIEILNQFGGLYVDVDFECLQPEMFTYLHRCYDFYAGIQPLDTKTLCVNNALIGAKKGHPILTEYIQKLRKNWYNSAGSLYAQVVVKTGPGQFTKACIPHLGKTARDIVLPPTFFYPLGFRQSEYFHTSSMPILRKKTARSESLAIHWWAKTWHSPKAQVKKETKP